MGHQDVLAAPAPITHGRQMFAGNTGLNYHGIAESSLTPVSGPQTYSTNGQLVQGLSFNNRIDITGDDVTIKNCKITFGGLDSLGFNIFGNRVVLEGCLIVNAPGTSYYQPVTITNGASSAVIRGCDISGGAQLVSAYGADYLMEYCYGHDVNFVSDPTQHPDVLEIYGGSGIIRFCNWSEFPFQADAIVNIAPFQAVNPNIEYLYVTDNLLGPGGQEIALADQQAAGGHINNLRFLRNDMDQGTNPDTVGSWGINRWWSDFQSSQSTIVETIAEQLLNAHSVVWPTSGPDVNRIVNYTRVSPDWSGSIAVPPQSHI